MNRKKWLAWRRGGICGSDVAAIMDRSQAGRKSAIDVYNDKLQIVPPFAPSEAMEWGHKLESLLAAEYAERTGAKYKSNQEMTIQGDGRFSWMRGTPDRLIVKPEYAFLDLKSSANGYGYGRNSEDDIPNEALFQLLWYMIITHRTKKIKPVEKAHIFLFANLEGRTYTVNYSKPIAAKVEEICANFWFDNILKRKPPAPNTDEDILGYMRKRYIELDGKQTKMKPEIEQLIVRYNRAKQHLEAVREESVNHLEEKVETLHDEIKKAAAGRTRMIGEKWELRWTNGGTIDWEALAKSKKVTAKEIEKFTDKTANRRLQIKERRK